MITTEVVNCPAFNIPEGEAGLFGAWLSADITKSGYIPIAATILRLGHPSDYNAVAVLGHVYPSNTLYFGIYSARTSAFSYGEGDITALVTYIKTPQ